MCSPRAALSPSSGMGFGVARQVGWLMAMSEILPSLETPKDLSPWGILHPVSCTTAEHNTVLVFIH